MIPSSGRFPATVAVLSELLAYILTQTPNGQPNSV